MAKRQVAGLKDSKGRTAPNPADPGDYLVEITEVKDVDHDKGGDFGWFYRAQYQVLDGPEQKDGRDPTAVRIFDSIFIMGPEHPSFEEYGRIGADTLAQIQIATGTKKKSDAFDGEELIGKVMNVRVDHRVDQDNTDDDGNPRVYTEVKRYWAEDE